MTKGGIDDAVRRNPKDQFPCINPGNSPDSTRRRSLVALSSSKITSKSAPSSVSRVNTDAPPSAVLGGNQSVCVSLINLNRRGQGLFPAATAVQ